MRLRNKKTGEIVELDLNVRIGGYPNGIEFMKVSSLAELNEEWEDYKPAEPLIDLTETPRVEDERSESEGKK